MNLKKLATSRNLKVLNKADLFRRFLEIKAGYLLIQPLYTLKPINQLVDRNYVQLIIQEVDTTW